MTLQLAKYVIDVHGQEEGGDLTPEELEIALHPNELEQALGEFFSGQLDREIFVKVFRVEEDHGDVDDSE